MTAAATSRLQALAARWAKAKAAERANAQSYLIELCEALGVERPRPAGRHAKVVFSADALARGQSAGWLARRSEQGGVSTGEGA